MNMYAISRCYFMKALHRSEEPLEIVANGTAIASAEAANEMVMEVIAHFALSVRQVSLVLSLGVASIAVKQHTYIHI